MIAIQMMAVRAMEALRTLRDGEEGQGLVEYGLILGLVSVLAVLALGVLSGDINGILETVGGDL